MKAMLRWSIWGMLVQLLVLSLLPPHSMAAVIGSPCCSRQFAMDLMSSLEKRPDEPFDVESKWLFQQLDKENRVSLVIAGAALDGYCTPSCPKRYAVAKAAVAIALSERSRAEDRSFRWGDRWFGLLYAVIAAIATLVSTGAIIVFSRAESRTEKAIHALVQQLSSGAGDVQQGTPADRKTAARFPVG